MSLVNVKDAVSKRVERCIAADVAILFSNNITVTATFFLVVGSISGVVWYGSGYNDYQWLSLFTKCDTS